MAILPIFIPHAGCPHQCVFCNQKTISGQKSAALDAAKEQLSRWLTYVQPDTSKEVAFYGGSFTALDISLQEQLLALTDELLAKGAIGSVRCSTRPDAIDAERMTLLQQHHVTTVELGVQSLDDAVLTAAERGHTAQQAMDAIKQLSTNGFTVGVQLMCGLPGQDEDSFRHTITQVVQLAPYIAIARLYPVLVIKGTPLADMYHAGFYVPLSIEEAVEQCAFAYETLTSAGIRVIRTGLQADGELCAPGNIVAGPWHPSMGELVKSRMWRNRLTPQLDACYDSLIKEVSPYMEPVVQDGVIRNAFRTTEHSLAIDCPAKLESQIRGMKNANIKYWQNRYHGLSVEIQPDTESDKVEACRLIARIYGGREAEF